MLMLMLMLRVSVLCVFSEPGPGQSTVNGDERNAYT